MNGTSSLSPDVADQEHTMKPIFDKVFEPIKPGDVPATYASTDKLQKAIEFKPSTTIEDGLQRFADWYVEYYNK